MLISNIRAETPNEHSILNQRVIAGHAQIGPFQEGSAVKMTELRPSGEPLTRTYNTHIRQNDGAYAIPLYSQVSDYVTVEVRGHYHNLIVDEVSCGPITLFAKSDLKGVSFVNVNVLTDIKRQRVGYLVRVERKSIKEAKKMAQAEILSIFGMEYENMPASESLDIIGDGKANAILLAITLILQADNSAGELEILLDKIGRDIRESGVLSDKSILESLWLYAESIDLQQVLQNISRAYGRSLLQISYTDVKKYIHAFSEQFSSAPRVHTTQAMLVDKSSATLHARLNPNGAATRMVFEYQRKGGERKTVSPDGQPFRGYSYVEISAVVDDLLPAKRYYYQTKAYNQHDTVYGRERSFVTSVAKKRRLSLGYHASIIVMDYSLSSSSSIHALGIDNVTAEPGIGWRIGIAFDLKINQSLSLLFSPAISFFDINVEYFHSSFDTPDNIIREKYGYSALDIPLSLEYSFFRHRTTRPYLSGGFQYVIPNYSMSSRMYPMRKPKNVIQATLGAGIKKQLTFVELSAELRAVHGLNHSMLHGFAGQATYHEAIERYRLRGLLFSLIVR